MLQAPCQIAESITYIKSAIHSLAANHHRRPKTPNNPAYTTVEPATVATTATFPNKPATLSHRSCSRRTSDIADVTAPSKLTTPIATIANTTKAIRPRSSGELAYTIQPLKATASGIPIAMRFKNGFGILPLHAQSPPQKPHRPLE